VFILYIDFVKYLFVSFFFPHGVILPVIIYIRSKKQFIIYIYIYIMDNIFFISNDLFKRSTGKANYDFINSLKNSLKYKITNFWGDENESYIFNEIQNIKPKFIVFFENSEFIQTKFERVFNLGIPIYLFLDDVYYMTYCSSNSLYSYLTNKVDGIIYWYKNENIFNTHRRIYPDKKILYVNSRYVNTNIYKDYNLEKKYDILFYGTRNFLYPYKKEKVDSIQNYIKKIELLNNNEISEETRIDFYPLRVKLENLLKNNTKYNVLFIPEKTTYDSIIANEDLSMLINQSYLTIACPSIADVLLYKHLEIPASKSVILGGYPSEYSDLFKDNVIEVNEFMSDDEIINIIDNALLDKQKLIDMSERFYKKIHEEHNLTKARENFDDLIDKIIKNI